MSTNSALDCLYTSLFSIVLDYYHKKSKCCCKCSETKHPSPFESVQISCQGISCKLTR